MINSQSHPVGESRAVDPDPAFQVNPDPDPGFWWQKTEEKNTAENF